MQKKVRRKGGPLETTAQFSRPSHEDGKEALEKGLPTRGTRVWLAQVHSTTSPAGSFLRVVLEEQGAANVPVSVVKMKCLYICEEEMFGYIKVWRLGA